MKVNQVYILTFFLILVSFNSCKKKVEQSNITDQLNSDYNENDYYKVQGLIVEEVKSFDYTDKYKRDIQYIYRLDLDKPLLGIERDTKLIIHIEEPVVVMVHKRDSTISFIGHRGIINEDLLVEYLTKPDSDYEEWLNKDAPQ